MSSRPSRSCLWFAGLLVLPAFVMLGSTPASAKAKPATAAKKHKPAAADKPEPAKKDVPAAPYETPSPASSESPTTATATDTSTSTGTTTTTATTTETATSTATSTEVAVEPAKETKPEEPRPLAETPAPPPPAAEPIPATVATGSEKPVMETPAPYVEHLGPKAFPGRLRGLYGGSLWLEPSFNGLQWPFMARTGVGVSGAFWTDTGYETIIRNDKDGKMPGSKMAYQQGRGVLRLTPTYVQGRFFIQGQAELVANQCQATTDICTASGTFSTDDLWIRFGEWNSWDIKVGRFEAWEIYHLGMGMDMYTLERAGAQQFPVGNAPNLSTPGFYGVNYLHDRPADGLGLGYFALHAYATEALRFELLGEVGTDNIQTTTDSGGVVKTGFTYLGGRPAMIYDVGWVKFKAALEYQQRIAVMQLENQKDASYYRTRMGGGAALQFVLDPNFEFGLNAAYGKQEETNPSDLSNGDINKKNSFSTFSVGGFANLRLANLWMGGVGLNWTTQTNQFQGDTPVNPADYAAHMQGFAALQYLLAGQLFIKATVGFARADFQPNNGDIPVWSNYMYSGRVRLMYLY
jgi:hypothetical protein